MGAISRNKYDVYVWLIKVIKSCNDVNQLKDTDNLLSSFKNTYNDKFLYNKCKNVWNEVYNKFCVKNKYSTIYNSMDNHCS